MTVFADLLRGAVVVSLGAATLSDGVVGFALMFLVLGGSLIPRLSRCSPGFDAAFVAISLACAWAALSGSYERITGLDLVAHAAMTGLVGALATHLCIRHGLLFPGTHAASDTGPGTGPGTGRAGTVLLSTALGTLLAVAWECGEFIGHTWLDERIRVGYTDTMGDLVAGMVGACVAGFLLGRQHSPAAPEESADTSDTPDASQTSGVRGDMTFPPRVSTSGGRG